MIEPRTIDAIIFDKDGTLFEETDALIREYQSAAIMGILDMVPGLSFEEAMATQRKSYQRFGWSFELLRQRYNLDFAAVHAAMHRHMSTHNVKPNPCLPAMLGFARATGLTLGVATHCGEPFATSNLDHLGITGDIIDRKYVTTLTDPKDDKAKSCNMVRHTAFRMGSDPSRTLFVENTARNLPPAKQAGFQTALITWGRDFSASEGFEAADACFDTPVKMMRTILQERGTKTVNACASDTKPALLSL